MKKKLLLGFVVGLMILIEGILIYGVELIPEIPLTPSREAWDGFAWQEVSGHGMRLLAQRNKVMRLVPVENGFAVKHDNGMEVSPIIEVLKKSWFESPERLIEKKFVEVLTEEQKAGCGVIPFTRKGFGEQDGMKRFTIAAVTDEYRAEAEKKMRRHPFFPCGVYGLRDAVTYFEYHDSRPGQLLFVSVGQDAPIFDEQSLEVIKKGWLDIKPGWLSL